MTTKDKGLKGAMLANLKKVEAPVEEEILPEETPEEKRTFAIPVTILEKMELEAFWDRKTMKDIIVELLTEHYKDKTFQPFPANYRKPKRGKPRKK